MPVLLVISICHPLLFVSCNDRMSINYATMLTQALLQVLASYCMQRFFQLPRLNSHSHALNSHSHPMADLIPIPMGIPWDPWDPRLPHSHAHLYLRAEWRGLIHSRTQQILRKCSEYSKNRILGTAIVHRDGQQFEYIHILKCYIYILG